MDNDIDRGNVFCGAVQDIQKNSFVVGMAEMYHRKCSHNAYRTHCRVYIQYKNAHESMGLFTTAVEFSWTDMSFIQCIVGSSYNSYTCVVRIDK